MKFWLPRYRYQLLEWFEKRGVCNLKSLSRKQLMAKYIEERKRILKNEDIQVSIEAKSGR